MNKNSYRGDITGLRALAVLSVLIFHIFPESLVGGYLGVDMFFVISGYLITFTLINEKQRTGNISLINFYKRRVFRIAPATIFAIFITIIAANLFLQSNDLTRASHSAVYSVLGFANLYFYQYLDTSYFATDIALNPLLHLWSLGVEEQFYFIFPLLFIFLSSRKKLFFTLLAVVGIISVIWASLIVNKDHMFAYYMLPTRAFGLILGCLGALYCANYHKDINNKIANVISVLSMAIVLLGIILISKDYSLPNYLSLTVVIPTALLIVLGYKNQGLIHKILGSIVFKHIGLWSFSIYLIHWIIISFYKNINGLHISLEAGALIFIVSIILGGLSYYLIEQTLRFKRWNLKVALLIFIGIPFIITNINYVHSKKIGKEFQKLQPEITRDEGTCHQNFDFFIYNKNNSVKDECTDNSTLEPNVIFWGDSNANHYIPALRIIAKEIGFGFRNITHSSCPALTTGKLEAFDKSKKRGPICLYNTNKSFEFVQNYDVVILSNSWKSIYNMHGGEALREKTDKTINDLSQTAKIIVVIGNIPIPDTFNINQVIKPNIFNKNTNNLQGLVNSDIFNEINPILKDIASKYPKAYYVDFNDILCNDTTCKISEGRNSIYRSDGTHLSVYGSEYLGSQYLKGNIDGIFNKIKDMYKESSKEEYEKNKEKFIQKDS